MVDFTRIPKLQLGNEHEPPKALSTKDTKSTKIPQHDYFVSFVLFVDGAFSYGPDS